MSPRRATPEAESALSSLLREIDLDHLRPSSAAVAEAKERAIRLVNELHRGPAWMFEVCDHGLFGSVSRGTALNRFNDLDWRVELDSEALRTSKGLERSARDTIRRLATAIRARRAGLVSLGHMEVRSQNHSVGVIYPSLRIDLVPVIRHQGSLYIPERETGNWKPTDPEESARRLKAAKAHAPHAGVAVRLLKAWRRARGTGAPISSFALETWVVNQTLEEVLPLDLLLVRFFVEVAEAHKSRPLALGGVPSPGDAVSVIDPVSNANLTARLGRDHRKRLIDAARAALVSLQRIEGLLALGYPKQAMTEARRLFVGDPWR
jgi:hypothetical protein